MTTHQAMKNLITTILIISVSTAAFSQKTFILSRQVKNGFLAVSGGGSLPLGKFAGVSSVDKQSGFASPGFSVNISAGYKVAGPVGLMVRAEQHHNPINTDAMLQSLYRNETDVWVASPAQWTTTTFMAGPYVTIPMGRLSVDVRLLAGQARATLPNTYMHGNFGNTENTVENTGGQSTALALGGGLALQYRLGRSISLQLTGDYSRADLAFTNLTTKVWSSNTGRSQTSQFNGSRVVEVVSGSVGVVFLFGNGNRPF